MDEILKSAIKKAKTVAIARVCGVSPQAVSQWRVAPADHVIKIAGATGFEITPHQLRPDLYPHRDDGLPDELRGRAAA